LLGEIGGAEVEIIIEDALPRWGRHGRAVVCIRALSLTLTVRRTTRLKVDEGVEVSREGV